MAFSVSPLRELSVEQLEVIVGERNKTGMHVYYTGGFDARKRAFSCVPPGKIEEPGALTFFIVNESASGQPAAFIRLGVYNHHYARFMEITMSATHYGARREINGVNAQFTPLVTTPVKGPHVVQYKRTGGRLEIHLDRQLFVDRDALQSAHDLDNLVVFYTDQGSGQLSPFVFHEAHWTVADVRRAVDSSNYLSKKDIAFFHDNVSVRVGGYVLYNGKWPAGRQITLWVGVTSVQSLSPSATEQAMVLLKMYRGGFIYSHVSEVATATINTQYTSFKLNELFITFPEVLTEYKVVTGETFY
ncbi:uncharacterized protein LOC144101217 [Amblyomma americanum]